MEATKHSQNNPATGDVGKTATVTAERLAAAAHERVDRAVEAARPAVDRAASVVHETVDKVAGAATQAAENLSTKSEYFKDAQNQLAEDCRLYLRDHPLRALGMAAVAGFVVSRLLRL